jgi:hypothetical protein
MAEPFWDDADETRLAQLFRTLPPPSAVGLGPTAQELARMVLRDQVDAGWRKAIGIIRLAPDMSAEQFERFKAEFELKAKDFGTWTYEVDVRPRRPWWRRLLDRRGTEGDHG